MNGAPISSSLAMTINFDALNLLFSTGGGSCKVIHSLNQRNHFLFSLPAF